MKVGHNPASQILGGPEFQTELRRLQYLCDMGSHRAPTVHDPKKPSVMHIHKTQHQKYCTKKNWSPTCCRCLLEQLTKACIASHENFDTNCTTVFFLAHLFSQVREKIDRFYVFLPLGSCLLYYVTKRKLITNAFAMCVLSKSWPHLASKLKAIRFQH